MIKEQQPGLPESTAELNEQPHPALSQRVEEYLKSKRFTSLAPHSQQYYRGDLQKFVQYMDDIDVTDTNTAMEHFLKFADNPWSATQDRTLAAIRGFYRWTVTEGIVEEKQLDKLYRAQTTERGRIIPKNPLTADQLESLLNATKKLRDRALIATITSTRTSAKGLQALRTGSVHKDGDDNTLVSLGGHDVLVPTTFNFAQIISDYKDSIPRGVLFPNRNKQFEKEPISRQAVDLILKDCREKAPELADLSHNILVATGIEIFGKLPNPNS